MIQSIKKSKKGISQILSVILLVSIAIIGSIIAYIYIMSYNVPSSIKTLETIQLENIVWSSPNEMIVSISNHASGDKIIDAVYVSGLRGIPSSYTELKPGERKDVRFIMENNIIPGEHTVKVVCKDGTIGVLAYRFIAPTQVTTTATTITTTTTTTITSPTTTGCLIVSAAYGSNLAPMVKFIQNFRDNVVAKTFIGSAFVDIFNKFYYSWSPTIAKIISTDSLIRDLTRIMIYPLIGAAMASFMVEKILSFNQEFAVTIAMIVGGFLFGFLYFNPIIYSIAKNRKIKNKDLSKVISLLIKPFFSFLFLVFIGFVIKSYSLTLFSITLTFLVSVLLGALIGAYSLMILKNSIKAYFKH